PKVSLIEPRYTPADRLVLDGVTVMVCDCPALIVPVLGLKSKKLAAWVAAPVKVSAFDVTFAIVKVCAFGEVPVVARNTSPLGDTLGVAGVPAGTIVKTTAIETGECFPSVGVRVTTP